MKFRAAALLALILCGSLSARAQDDEPVRRLLSAVERAVQAGDAVAYFALLGPSANRNTSREFVSTELMPGATRVALHERDRRPLQGTAAGAGYSLLVETIAEFGTRARIATWRIDVKRTGQPGSEHEWSISDQERLSSVENIYRVSLNATKS